ncbi:MAG: flagellar hook protein [Lachnospiraceae bacterium]|nr:flagellar hook protein [Lachnospiraceae bacterium]
MVVQHNMQAMNSNRVLGTTTTAQGKITEKLSSGYKINRAADDAAGLTISEKMRKQIKGLDRASTNAQDGVSAVQTAEGALTEVHSMLQRMEELATQAANGTNSKSDRDAIQAEITQLSTEIDRVSETTMFNETYLLKGDQTQPSKTINLKAHDAGLAGSLVDNGDGTATFTMDKLKVGDKITIGGKQYTIGGSTGDVKKAVMKALYPKASEGEYGAVASTPKVGDTLMVNGAKYTYFASGTNGNKESFARGWYILDPTATQETSGRQISDIFVPGADIVANGKEYHINKDADANGVDDLNTAIITVDKAYTLAAKELKDANGIGDTEAHVDVTQGTGNNKNKFTINVAQTNIPETLAFNLHVGADADMTNKINVAIEPLNANFLGLTGINVSDTTGMAATYAIDAIGDALAKVSAQRSSLGAIQNRLEHTIANLDNISENTTAAESRIRDTDMAAAMVEYSKNNILAQAGQSMLAQANQSTQGVMSLLQ